jgi:hypothetical protein
MPYIIDGHNLIGKLPSIDLADPDDELQLIQLLIGFLRNASKRGTVFFDRGLSADSRENSFGRLEVRFVRPPQTADDAIRSYLQKIKSVARNFTVVSSDRSILKAARLTGARWMKSEEFASLLSPKEISAGEPEKPEILLSPREIENWERLFGNRKADK